MLALITVVVVFSSVIVVHELGHFLAARRMGVKVEKFSLGLGKALLSKKFGETEYVISAIPFGGYVKMAGEEPSDKHDGRPYEFYAKPPGKRFWILLAGAGVNFILAFLIFSIVAPIPRVGLVIEDMPAGRAGIQIKDRIISINGRDVRYWNEVLDIISKSLRAMPLQLRIERGGELLDMVVTPEMIESKDLFGRKISTPKIGIWHYGDVEVIKANPLQSLLMGARQTFDNTAMTYMFLWRIITRQMPVKGAVTGPVGIAVILGEAAKIGLIYLLYLVGHINLALAIFNLLPFPVLDGGHIFFLGLEKIRRRPLSLKTQEVMQYAAITLLAAFFIFVSYNDIMVWVLKK